MANDNRSNQLNLTVVALVALVAIVGLVALVMNAASVATMPALATGSEIASAQPAGENLAGEATRQRPARMTPRMPPQNQAPDSYGCGASFSSYTLVGVNASVSNGLAVFQNLYNPSNLVLVRNGEYIPGTARQILNMSGTCTAGSWGKAGDGFIVVEK